MQNKNVIQSEAKNPLVITTVFYQKGIAAVAMLPRNDNIKDIIYD